MQVHRAEEATCNYICCQEVWRVLKGQLARHLLFIFFYDFAESSCCGEVFEIRAGVSSAIHHKKTKLTGVLSVVLNASECCLSTPQLSRNCPISKKQKKVSQWKLVTVTSVVLRMSEKRYTFRPPATHLFNLVYASCMVVVVGTTSVHRQKNKHLANN